MANLYVFMEKEEIENLFAKASKLDGSGQVYLTEEEWAVKKRLNGAVTFKRRALGFCGFKTVKSLEDMAKLLQDTGIVSYVEEGRKLTPSLVGCRVSYGLAKEIEFDEVTDSKGNKAYRISACSYHYDL